MIFSIAKVWLEFKKFCQNCAHGSKMVVKTIEWCLKVFLFSYLSCSQIWLNLPINDCHQGLFIFISHVGEDPPKQITINGDSF